MILHPYRRQAGGPGEEPATPATITAWNYTCVSCLGVAFGVSRPMRHIRLNRTQSTRSPLPRPSGRTARPPCAHCGGQRHLPTMDDRRSAAEVVAEPRRLNLSSRVSGSAQRDACLCLRDPIVSLEALEEEV